MPEIVWFCKHFKDLHPAELYAIMRLRSEVFVVEQNCVFLDADDNDQQCYHLTGLINKELAAYSRLVPPGVTYPGYVSIGRVTTSPRHRKNGAGKALMQQSIDECNNLFGKQTIKIGAQLYLKNFYESFGFKQSGGMYLEDDIPHISMLREAIDNTNHSRP